MWATLHRGLVRTIKQYEMKYEGLQIIRGAIDTGKLSDHPEAEEWIRTEEIRLGLNDTFRKVTRTTQIITVGGRPMYRLCKITGLTYYIGHLNDR